MEGLEIDDLILNAIDGEPKTVKQISEEINIGYTRVSIRMGALRKANQVIFMQSGQTGMRGVRPLKYLKKRNS